MSFSAYSTLSFQLDLFFSGYLNKLRNDYIEKDQSGKDKFDKLNYPVYQFRDWLNILYSGGDDLFVVGRWDKTIEFAKLVRKEFEAYTRRTDIGISGGIAFVHEKFPISKAAEMAGDAEKVSKKQQGKDAITFFGETVRWKEFGDVKKYYEELKNLCENEKLSRGLLHKLMHYAEVKKQAKDFSYKWHTAYYLKRYKDRYDKNPAIKAFIDRLIIDLMQNQNYDLYALAARWAEVWLKYYSIQKESTNV